jgi:hypothetical protein
VAIVQRRGEHRHRDAEARHRVGQRMDHRGYHHGGDRGAEPQAVAQQQIGRHQHRDHRAADIDRDHRPRPLRDLRHHVVHSEKMHDLSRDIVPGQHRDRNVEIAADQRADQQEKRAARRQPEPQIGVAQDIELDENQQTRDRDRKHGEHSRRKREIVGLAYLHAGRSVGRKSRRRDYSG